MLQAGRYNDHWPVIGDTSKLLFSFHIIVTTAVVVHVVDVQVVVVEFVVVRVAEVRRDHFASAFIIFPGVVLVVASRPPSEDVGVAVSDDSAAADDSHENERDPYKSEQSQQWSARVLAIPASVRTKVTRQHFDGIFLSVFGRQIASPPWIFRNLRAQRGRYN